MKLKLTLLSILLGCVSSVHANLIELTPGGFHWTPEGTPQIVTDWYNNVRSTQYLFYPPEQYFTITGIGTPEVTMSWNFGLAATFQYLFVIYQADDGTLFANFYQVPIGHMERMGEATVTINGTLPVTFINPFGQWAGVPDTGKTLFLFGIGLIGLIGYSKYKLIKN